MNQPAGSGNSRRALLLGAIALVVVAAVIVGVLVLRNGDSEAAGEWPDPAPGETVAAPDVPSSLPKPSIPVESEPTETTAPAAVAQPEPTSDDAFDELADTAEDEGTVPVIVTLRPKITPEGTLPASRRAIQQERIENSGERLLEDLQGTQVENVEQFEAVPLVTLEATPEAIEELRNSPDVISVVEDIPLPLPIPPASSAPSQGAERQWGENDTWWHIASSEIETAWNNGFDGRGQTVAVLDTGVESNHPWLAGKVVDEACFSFARSCPGGLDTATGPGSGGPCTYAESCGHGTHVSHDAAGKYGVARGANIIAVQVFSQVTEGCASWEGTVCARSYISDQLKGLQRVYELRETRPIAAVNLSLGGGSFADYCDDLNTTYSGLVKTLVSYGIAVVIATGNDGFVDGVGEPSCYRDALATGATTLDAAGAETVASFSNRAPRILNVLAPGSFICSAWTAGTGICGDGTSYATPLVAGTFATLRQLNPQASVTAMREAISCSGVPLNDGGAQRARLSVWRAVNALKDGC